MADERDGSRRDFIKKAAYIAPTVLTLSVALVEARAGSGGGSGRDPMPRTREPGRATGPRYNRNVER
jgi:hypothetical protein